MLNCVLTKTMRDEWKIKVFGLLVVALAAVLLSTVHFHFWKRTHPGGTVVEWLIPGL